MPFPIELKYIKEAEVELGVQFPKSFIEKMKKENGGEFSTDEDDWTIYPFFDKLDNKRISRTCNHIVLETNQLREIEGFPKNGIAIAENGCGDNLIMLPFQENQTEIREKIYIWLHETREIIEIANSIEDLIE
ncbi:SMI1/KNR4 family protein [Flavobacterium sp. I-SCBP12n]|uniref:SMI1/KNR4 family protein n=1 Tax=Flavobacterium pygoscelis TaxID=2893176 RepID=A0A9X1Y120_9FLAO|nr:SMI1/KNR4 family protein [Flavobacterium pygoscelis]MCK8143337.1 SMI1/KNR4 family protein [Flavobacterium pygoscelis]MCK8143432.1 SMI1/KNR4 family protein [Flavobacterium pygoscelis]